MLHNKTLVKKAETDGPETTTALTEMLFRDAVSGYTVLVQRRMVGWMMNSKEFEGIIVTISWRDCVAAVLYSKPCIDCR
jgi:hypothetical protein